MAAFSQLRRLATQFLRFAMENKVWWMLPLVLVLALLGALALAARTPYTPFVYPLY